MRFVYGEKPESLEGVARMKRDRRTCFEGHRMTPAGRKRRQSPDEKSSSLNKRTDQNPAAASTPLAIEAENFQEAEKVRD